MLTRVHFLRGEFGSLRGRPLFFVERGVLDLGHPGLRGVEELARGLPALLLARGLPGPRRGVE